MFAAGGVKMNSESGQVLTWHEDCLQCSVCHLRVSLDNVVFREKLFCKSCYIENNLHRCDKCDKVTGKQPGARLILILSVFRS